MKGNDIMRAMSNIDEKYLTESEPIVKRRDTGKHRKRFAAMIAAAAVMAAGTIGAGAYYAVTNGTWNGMRSAFDSPYGEAPELLEPNKMQALENITVHDGELVENTFEGIDVTFDGLVSGVNAGNGSSSYMIFTLSKTDGTAFTQPDEGWHYMLRYAEGSYQQNGWQPLYKDTIYNIRANEDGTLSVTLEGFTYEVLRAERAKDYPIRVGFTDLYLEPDVVYDEVGCGDESLGYNSQIQAIGELSVDTGNAFAEMCSSSDYLTHNGGSGFDYEQSWSGDPLDEDSESAERFRELDEQLKAAHEEIAAEVYSGRILFDIDSSQLGRNGLTLEAEYEGEPITVCVDPLMITVTGYTNRSFGFNGEDMYPPELTVIYKDGSTETLASFSCGTSSTPSENKYTWSIDYEDSEPFDPETIAAVEFDSVKVELNG